MYWILYLSKATRVFTEDELSELCRVSVANNSGHGVTGFLIHFDGLFLQILEGPRTKVEELFARISQDNRHRDVTVLISEEAPGDKGSFRFWAMNCGVIQPEDFSRRVLGRPMTGAQFREYVRDPDAALDILTHAYVECSLQEGFRDL